MPVCVARKGMKWRLVECKTGKVVKNSAGTAVDGGGHNSKSHAQKQANAINIHQHENK